MCQHLNHLFWRAQSFCRDSQPITLRFLLPLILSHVSFRFIQQNFAEGMSPVFRNIHVIYLSYSAVPSSYLGL